MTPIEKGVVAILLVGNVLLWSDLCSPRAARSFDFELFRNEARAAFPDSGLVELPFDVATLLPDEYVYLEGAGSSPWFSVYVGYYPSQGLTGDEPHDPRRCYGVEEFTTLQEDVMELRVPDLPGPLFVKRLLVEHRSSTAEGSVERSERIAYFWSHSRGALPSRYPDALSGLRQLPERVLSRRSDLAWVRVEFLPPESTEEQALSTELDPETIGRIYRMMQATAACML